MGTTVINRGNDRKTDAIVMIPTLVNNGIAYLLNRFKTKEWSGPAWYSVEPEKDGFPSIIKLEHFIPLHLGGSGATEWDDNLLTPHLERMMADPKMAENLKVWTRGNIHSHHTMNAFVSGTDEATIIENAPETLDDFYFSLIVSSTSQYDFGFSYRDQFGFVHWFRADSVVIGDNDNIEDHIFSQAAIIENESKPSYNYWQGNGSKVDKKYKKYNTQQATPKQTNFGFNKKKILVGESTSPKSIIPMQLEDDDISHHASIFTYGEDGEDAILMGDKIFTLYAIQIYLAYKNMIISEAEAEQELLYENTTIEEMKANEGEILTQS